MDGGERYEPSGAHFQNIQDQTPAYYSPVGSPYPSSIQQRSGQSLTFQSQGDDGSGKFVAHQGTDGNTGGIYYDSTYDHTIDPLQVGYPSPAPEDDASTQGITSGPPKSRFTARFLTSGLLRWAISALLSGLYYVVIRLYQDRTLSPGEKSTFDAIIVAVSLALGLNIAAALNSTALHLRWWFLGKRRMHIREVSFSTKSPSEGPRVREC